MTIQNANDHPYKVAIVKDSIKFANSHPFKVQIEGGGGSEARVVDELPEVGESGYIYLVLRETTKEGDIYDEYIWVLQQDGETYGWEHLGATNEVKVPTVVQTTGTSTEDVMSQNAVTNALASAGPTVVQVTGTSTANVMSQNATTSMVYVDPSTKKRIQIGNNAKAGDRANFNSIAIGDGAKAYTGNDVVIGNNAQTSKSGASTVGGGNVAIGRSAAVSKTNTLPEGGIAIGDTAVSDASFTTAIGAHTNAQGVGSIALGSYATTTSAQRGVMNIGTTVTNWGYSSSNYRLLTGLYDPQSTHDAATKGYVDTAVAGVATNTINSTDWSTLWQ